METKLFALSIDLKVETSTARRFRFTETQIRAMLAGLSSIYQEVFIWPTENEIGVWVMGNNPSLMYHTFQHYNTHYNRCIVLEENDPKIFFDNIISGKNWHTINVEQKLFSLIFSKCISHEAESLGDCLTSMLEEGIDRLQANPVFEGNRNGWRYSRETEGLCKSIKTSYPEFFFHFSVN